MKRKRLIFREAVDVPKATEPSELDAAVLALVGGEVGELERQRHRRVRRTDENRLYSCPVLIAERPVGEPSQEVALPVRQSLRPLVDSLLEEYRNRQLSHLS